MVADRIEREILIKAPVDVVWGVEPEHIAGWFSDTAEIDLRPGGEGTLTFEQRATIGRRVVSRLRVASVDPPRKFAFRWGHPEDAQPGPGNSVLVEFTLTAEGENTRLRVVESGLRGVEWSDERKATYRDEHLSGWEMHLTSLRDYAARASHATAHL